MALPTGIRSVTSKYMDALALQRHLTHGLSYMPLRDVVIATSPLTPSLGSDPPVGVSTTHMPAPWTPVCSLGAACCLTFRTLFHSSKAMLEELPEEREDELCTAYFMATTSCVSLPFLFITT